MMAQTGYIVTLYEAVLPYVGLSRCYLEIDGPAKALDDAGADVLLHLRVVITTPRHRTTTSLRSRRHVITASRQCGRGITSSRHHIIMIDITSLRQRQHTGAHLHVVEPVLDLVAGGPPPRAHAEGGQPSLPRRRARRRPPRHERGLPGPGLRRRRQRRQPGA